VKKKKKKKNDRALKKKKKKKTLTADKNTYVVRSGDANDLLCGPRDREII
jgi:hypothetical protein